MECILDRSELPQWTGCGCKANLDFITDAFRTVLGASSSSNPAKDVEDAVVIEDGHGRLVWSVDFAPPVGIDMRISGRIAALHAFSDVFAVGGTPIEALVLLAGNAAHGDEYLEALMTGIVESCQAEQVQIKGGHTIINQDGLVGLCVVGRVTSQMIGKVGAVDGDHLLMSKALGVGAIVRAFSLGLENETALKNATDLMQVSNSTAATAAMTAGVKAMTDITGFGLIGHLSEMLTGNRGARIDMAAIPILDAARRAVTAAGTSVWLRQNIAYASQRKRLEINVNEDSRALLADPQTNGPLLVAAGPQQSEELLKSGLFCAIGQVTSTDRIDVRPGGAL